MESRFEIEGGRKLFGKVRIKSAKNAVLPILAASIMTEEESSILDCPDITDISAMTDILSLLGAKVERKDGTITVSGEARAPEVPKELAVKMRSSVFLLGSLLASCGHALLFKPGGCNIGARPIDIHIQGLRALGVKITETEASVVCDGRDMRACDVTLKGVSVGATENMMTASVFLKGRTVIRNAAREPEIVDLQNFLNASGARIKGAGTSVIEIEGVKKLHGVTYLPIPDRIVAGTVMCAVAACGGEAEIENVRPEHLIAITRKLQKSACQFGDSCDNIVVSSCRRPKSFSVSTGPYPRFPTDMQAQFMAVAAVAEGVSRISENLFETRFNHAAELTKLGAKIEIEKNVATVYGRKELFGARLRCFDLRGGAATIVAALAAKGKSEVFGIGHVDRGYEKFENTLASLGAVIKRI